MSGDRQRGIQVHRPIIYGSHARLLSDTERSLAPAGREWSHLACMRAQSLDTHRWTIFLTSAASPPPPKTTSDEIDMDELPGGADDMTYMMKRVSFKLHETYPNPNRGAAIHFQLAESCG